MDGFIDLFFREREHVSGERGRGREGGKEGGRRREGRGERVCVCERETREREKESQAGTTLTMEPDTGLDCTTLGS